MKHGMTILLLAFAFPSALDAAPLKISPEALLKMQIDGDPALIVADVRSPADFAKGRSFNVIPANLSSVDYPQDAKIAVYCSAQTCDLAENAAELLQKAGYANVYVLEGGIEQWQKKGFPVESGSGGKPASAPAPVLTAAQVNKSLESGEFRVIDVRSASEFSAGHLPRALNIPLEELESRLAEVPAGKDVVVYDRTSARGQAAADILRGHGRRVFEMSGGIMAWIKMRFPLEVSRP